MPDRTDSERDLFWKRAVLARLYTAFIKERTMILLAAVLSSGKSGPRGVTEDLRRFMRVTRFGTQGFLLRLGRDGQTKGSLPRS